MNWSTYGGPSFPATIPLSPNTWYLVSVSCVAGGTETSYVNNQVDYSGAALSYNKASGSFYFTYSGFMLNGQIGGFRMYNRALTQADISNIFSQERGIYGV